MFVIDRQSAKLPALRDLCHAEVVTHPHNQGHITQRSSDLLGLIERERITPATPVQVQRDAAGIVELHNDITETRSATDRYT